MSAERVGKKYGQLIEKIKEASPNSKIYVISLTYIVMVKKKSILLMLELRFIINIWKVIVRNGVLLTLTLLVK